jgi:hypothetical protein
MITLPRFRSIALRPLKTGIEILWLDKFMTWTAQQNENRLAWIGIVLTVHGCFLTPLAAMTVMVTTYNFSLFMAVIASMALALVTNLAALPTKITIPVFFLTVVIDIIIMSGAVISTL